MKTLTIREMQIKMTVRCNFISTRMAKIKKIITSANKDMEKLEHLHIAGRNTKWYRHFVKQFGSSSKCCMIHLYKVNRIGKPIKTESSDCLGKGDRMKSDC